MKRSALVLITLVLIGGGIFVKTYQSYKADTQGSATGAPVSFTVPPGASLAGLGPALQAVGVIGSSRDFHIWLRTSGATVSLLQPGNYNMRRAMPYAEVVSVLSKGPVISYQKVTIPEGLTVTETASRVQAGSPIQAADFLAAATVDTVAPPIIAPGVTTLEGFLYPQTYFITKKQTAPGLVKEMVGQFVSETAGLDWSSAPPGITPYQVVTVASLIQNEAKAPSDAPLIAGVIYNRLKAHMLLGIDATTYYAAGKSFSQPLLASDLANKSPWNTRAVAGLPPTPISSPRLSNIQAALSPAVNNNLYYLLGADCLHHDFFSSAAAFQAATVHQPKCG